MNYNYTPNLFITVKQMNTIHVNKNIQLQPITESDKDRLQLLANEVEMWKNVWDNMPYPYTLADEERRINHCNEIIWSDKVWQYGIYIDWIYAWNIWREHKETGRHQYNYHIWYRIWKPYWWKGYMTEIVIAFTNHIFNSLPCHRCDSRVFWRNEWSKRVLEKAWYICEWIRKEAIYYEWERHDEYLFWKINTNQLHFSL